MTLTVPTAPALPPAQAWLHASYERPCPTCERKIAEYAPVAFVLGVDGGSHVCPNCTSSPQPRRTG